VSVTPLLVIGTAAVLAKARGFPVFRITAAATVALCVWWNLGLMAQFGLHTMDRERLTLGDNARQTFVTLPRTLPSLGWRHLTNRASFYNQPRQ
jgi:hypothetical protein